MSTDAQPHLPLDIDKFDPVQFPDLPRGLPLNSGTISTGDVDYECFFLDYPSAEQVKTALKSMDVYLVILTPDDPAIVPSWKWVNENLLGQPSSFYQLISADSSDLLSGVLKAVEAVTDYACPTTTTPEPTTVASTLVATTSTTSATSTLPPTTMATSSLATTASEAIVTTTAALTSSETDASDSTEAADVSPVGTTEATIAPSEGATTTSAICPPCPTPCPQPCPTTCCCDCPRPCLDHECNEGVLIVISDKPQHVNITLA